MQHKKKSDGKEWVILAEAPYNGKEGIFFQYGTVKIKNSTSMGKGFTVPKNKDFEIHVSRAPGAYVETSKFSAEQAKNLKKIVIDADGNAKPA